MNDFPEWIKLVPNGINSFESTNRQNNHSKKYIRADVAAQRIRELESTNAKLREALMDLRSDLRELSEREGGLYAHFYARTCKALEPPR